MPEHSAQIPCRACPLRALPVFSRGAVDEVDFMQKFKMGELHARSGGAIYLEGATSPHLFTLLSGWAFRYKTLRDGRRQILNYVLPGDFIGLQTTLTSAMDHGVEALTDVRLCSFSRRRLPELFVDAAVARTRHHLARGARGALSRRASGRPRPPKIARTHCLPALAPVQPRTRFGIDRG